MLGQETRGREGGGGGWLCGELTFSPLSALLCILCKGVDPLTSPEARSHGSGGGRGALDFSCMTGSGKGVGGKASRWRGTCR